MRCTGFGLGVWRRRWGLGCSDLVVWGWGGGGLRARALGMGWVESMGLLGKEAETGGRVQWRAGR